MNASSDILFLRVMSTVNITVKKVDGTTVEISIDSSATVEELKDVVSIVLVALLLVHAGSSTENANTKGFPTTYIPWANTS